MHPPAGSGGVPPELEHADRQVGPDDVRLLQKQVGPLGGVEFLRQLPLQRVVFGIAVLHRVEPVLVGRASEHGSLVARGIPGEAEEQHLEIVGLGGGREQVVGRDRARRHRHTDGPPRRRHGRDQGIVDGRSGVDHREPEGLPVLVANPVTVSVRPAGLSQELLGLVGVIRLGGLDLPCGLGQRRHRLSAR